MDNMDEINKLYFIDQWAIRDIAAHFGFTMKKVREVVQERSKSKRPIISKERLEKHLKGGLSYSEIARMVGCRVSNISMLGKKYGLGVCKPANKDIYIDPRDYSLRPKELSRKYGLSITQVYWVRAKFKMARMDPSEMLTYGVCRDLHEREVYLEDISSQFQIATTTVRKYFKACGFPLPKSIGRQKFDKETLEALIMQGCYEWEAYSKMRVSRKQFFYLKDKLNPPITRKRVVANRLDSKKRSYFEDRYVVEGKTLEEIANETGVPASEWDQLRILWRIPQYQ